MRHFILSRAMTNMRGVFYPTGHIVLMFPTAEDAEKAAELLRQDGISEDDLLVASPDEFEHEITSACDDADDMLLPSIGTEADTAQHFRRLAHEGHHALIVHASAKVTSDHVLELLKDTHISYGQRYRFLVIEDMVGDASQ